MLWLETLLRSEGAGHTALRRDRELVRLEDTTAKIATVTWGGAVVAMIVLLVHHPVTTAGRVACLVTLSVSTGVDQAVAAADATDAIVTGFRVAVPGAVPPAPYSAPLRGVGLSGAFAYSTARARSSTNASTTPGAVLGRVMQKCSAGGS